MTDSITYSLARPFPAADVQKLFRQTAWAATRSLDGVQAVLDRSVCVGAWQADRLVGFARTVTDDLYRAFIEDVIVDEALRGQGIGSELVGRLLVRLDHVEEIVLSCEEHLAPFYEHMGFRRVTHPFLNIWKGG
ncbi:MAG TPA: GNAT family N-acetyltransferase [Aggregatilineaceae bacterium]|jgi:predicted GNAT family N-acyltransferase|nr:GNAT family N-acetyltransferase [Aggregatilineaceae bacterium]